MPSRCVTIVVIDHEQHVSSKQVQCTFLLLFSSTHHPTIQCRMSLHLLFTAFLGSLSTLETSLTSPAATSPTAPASACPDTTLYPTDLNMTFFTGDENGRGCTGGNTTVTGIDYAVGRHIPIDSEGNMIYRSYQLSRDLQPGETVDWSRWGIMPDHEGRLLNWACGTVSLLQALLSLGRADPGVASISIRCMLAIHRLARAGVY